MYLALAACELALRFTIFTLYTLVIIYLLLFSIKVATAYRLAIKETDAN